MIIVAILTIAERAAFDAFEARAATVMARHGGAIERRIAIDGAPAREVHVVCFPDRGAWDAYRGDPDLTALRALRARGVAATEMLIGEEIES